MYQKSIFFCQCITFCKCVCVSSISLLDSCLFHFFIIILFSNSFFIFFYLLFRLYFFYFSFRSFFNTYSYLSYIFFLLLHLPASSSLISSYLLFLSYFFSCCRLPLAASNILAGWRYVFESQESTIGRWQIECFFSTKEDQKHGRFLLGYSFHWRCCQFTNALFS